MKPKTYFAWGQWFAYVFDETHGFVVATGDTEAQAAANWHELWAGIEKEFAA